MYNKLQSMFIAEKYHKAHNFHTNMKQQLHFKKTRKKEKKDRKLKRKTKGKHIQQEEKKPRISTGKN